VLTRSSPPFSSQALTDRKSPQSQAGLSGDESPWLLLDRHGRSIVFRSDAQLGSNVLIGITKVKEGIF
jgi:hypothetical protein